MNKETLYQVVKDIYLSKIFNKSALDFRIMIFKEKIKSLFKKYKNPTERMRNIEEIYHLINIYLGVSEVEKKQHGEVFTDFRLINEMLDTLPVEVWSNPTLKWLDPANGVGNFPAVVIGRLMIGLRNFEPDDDKRYKHILENMIYVCDISPKNMFLYNNIFDPNDEFKLNAYRGSFLDKGFDNKMKEWGVENFDIIMGNPPYQSNEDRQEKGNKVKGYKQPLWPLFIKKSLLLLVKNGYLLMITPKSWLAGTYDIRNGRIFLKDMFSNEYNLLYFNIKNSLNKYFGVGSTFSYYLVKNENYNGKSLMISDYEEKIIDLRIIKAIPLDPIPMKISINEKTLYSKLEKFDFKSVNFNRKVKTDTKEPTKDNIYKGYCNGGQKGKIIYSYWNSPDKYYKMRKIIIGKQDRSYLPFVDDEGLCIGQNQLWYFQMKDVDKSENAIFVFNSKLFKFLIQENKHGAGPETILIYSLPKLDLSKSWTDEELYKYFNLTQEEIDLIEKTIK